ncbi:hypothetical protein [Escherichia coli]
MTGTITPQTSRDRFHLMLQKIPVAVSLLEYAGKQPSLPGDEEKSWRS